MRNPEQLRNNTQYVPPSDDSTPYVQPSQEEISHTSGIIRHLQHRHAMALTSSLVGGATAMLSLGGIGLFTHATRFIRSADEIDPESGVQGFGDIFAKFECEADLIAQKHINKIRAIE